MARAPTCALAAVPELLGLRDGATDPLPNHHPLVARLEKVYPGVRIPRTGAVIESLVPAILEQKVTGREAHRALFGLIAVHGEPAPGPPDLAVAPTAHAGDARPAALLRLPPVRCRAAPGRPHPPGHVRARPGSRGSSTCRRPMPKRACAPCPGSGRGPSAEVAVRALGDEDAVSVGDFHLPEPRGLRARRGAARHGRSGCSSSSNRGAASGRGSCASSSSAGSRRRATDHASRRAGIQDI